MAGFDPEIFGDSGGVKGAGFDPEVFTVTERQPKPAAASLPPVNRAYQAGRNAEGWKQGIASVMNGPLFGFADELGGALGAAVDKATGAGASFGDIYRERRDNLRGMQDQQRDENPWMTGITQAMASAPMAALSPLRVLGIGGNAAAKTGVIANSGRAAATGASYGAATGAGNSTAEDMGGVAGDAGRGALLGAAIGGVSTPVAAGMGAAGRNMWDRFSDASAGATARAKVAEAFARDARGNAVVSGRSDPSLQASRRLDRIGPDAAVVDAGGKSTLQLLDTMATLPGRTQEAVAQFQRQRAATSGARMRASADDALGTGGQRLTTTLESLDATRSAAARPLYQQLEGVAVTVDDDLLRLISRTKGHHGDAQNLHRLATGEEIALSELQKGQTVPFKMLDHLKQSLDDAGVAAKRAGNNKMGLAVDDARVALLAKLDDMAPKANGQSVYKAARDAYAGPSQLKDAAEAGRKAIQQDETAILDALRGLSTSEQEAFRIGAFEGLRAKLGTQSGRTNVMNMWQEQTTREKLLPIFGSERAFREFAVEVAKEGVKKRVQGVNQGSQTARRMMAAGDLDAGAIPQVATALSSATSGNPIAAIGPAAAAWNRVSTPQNVRDEIGRLLMLRGPQLDRAGNPLLHLPSEPQRFMGEISGLLAQINRNNGLLADTYGITGGLLGSNLAPSMPLGLLNR